ncbi:sigma-70 family RNA polymerase sigma factor [Rubritalea tangerina]|uniref:Sigma-70 family RNA polymerase sigma factor n=2 Tax=Rubritalea tangerina TaxID=430798 RepID=A0ABW4ZD29_9BACT
MPTEPHSDAPPQANDLLQEIDAIQVDLRGYVISIAGSAEDIDDIIQETNLFLWERQNDFTPGTSFKAWAFKVAYFKSMAQRRDAIRRGHVTFSESTIQRISIEAENHFTPATDRVAALRHCLQKLKPDDQNILYQKYVKGASFTDFAKHLGKPVNSIHQIASRARLALRQCIQQQLSKS